MHTVTVYTKLLVVAVVLTSVVVIRADESVQFSTDVLPILADHCLKCHGLDSTHREAGLRLDVQSQAILTLSSGKRAIVPGDARLSEMWRRVSSEDEDLRMPPPSSGTRLSNAQIELLRRWIEQGAEYEAHWAYSPPTCKELAQVAAGSYPIDGFILARLAVENIPPSPPADRATLIRRVTLDLTGLPPAMLEVDAFVNDQREDAYERVVDRLLRSEHFGERWARWWLDLAHYGDSDGYLQDFLRPVAWRYRQWVVDAFNRDQPFDQFTIEQLAGDLLPDATVAQRMGTGFLRNTLSNREGGADLEEYRVRQVIDRTVTVATTWLGLTVACAECHDHKFDAISQREFYQLYAIFNNADEVNFNAPLTNESGIYATAKHEYDLRRADLLAPVAQQLAELQADWERRLLHTESHPGEDFAWDRTLELLGLQWGQDLGEGQLEGLNIIKTPVAKRTQDQVDRLLDYFLQTAPAHYQAKFVELKVNELKVKLDALAKTLPQVTRAPGMMTSPVERVTCIHIRGDYRRRGEVVKPGTPAVLPPMPVDGPVDRLALARWLVAPNHPLTARVTVNRLWQELFGRGLVATSDNFGVRGEPPSHSQLLDWLALQFQRDGWSIKSILKHIVLSQTYQQSSMARPDLATRDPLNRLLARQARLRLTAEGVRDATLAVSGQLNRSVGGPSVKPPQPASVSKEGYRNSWEASVGPDRCRRGLYTFIQRTSPFAQFVTFDLPDTSRSCTRRERSNTPLQALQLLNDPVFLEAAQALASRIHREAAQDELSRLAYAFQLILSRPILPIESERLLAYLSLQREQLAGEPDADRELREHLLPGTDAAWVGLASVLLNLDEFITRE